MKAKEKQRKVKKNKGITLIALVITIIVLLILAGISIMTLAGDNGVLTKATQSKTKNQKAEVEEQIRLALITAGINEEGNLDLAVLEDELTKSGITGIEKQGADGKLPWKITHKGFIFQITEDGKVVKVNGITLNKTELKLLQGQEETLTATKTEGISGNIIWSSSDPSVAKVENGKVTAVGTSGTAEITASVAGTEYSVKCRVMIVQKVTGINISNFEIGTGEEKQIADLVTTTPTGEVEDLEYEVASSPTGIVSFTNGKIKGITQGTATLTVKAKRKDGTGVGSKTCTVTVTGLVGKFVKYDVAYTDMYLNDAEGNPLTYSTTNGWRLLNYKDNKDGTYSDVELISTGIPAKLYCYFTGSNNEWFVKEEQELDNFKSTVLGNDYTYYEGSSTYYGLQASAGMYKNLKDIVFRYGTRYVKDNQGYYKSIINTGKRYNETENTTEPKGRELFKVGDVDIRMLTLPEINKARGNSSISSQSIISTTEDKIGLYRLDQLKNVSGMEKYYYNIYNNNYGYYWIASPDPGGSSGYGVCLVATYGGVMRNGPETNADCGVRPVVSLKSDIRLELAEDGTYFEMK